MGHYHMGNASFFVLTINIKIESETLMGTIEELLVVLNDFAASHNMEIHDPEFKQLLQKAVLSSNLIPTNKWEYFVNLL